MDVFVSPLKTLIRCGDLLAASCKGLILIFRSSENVFVLWNPFTRESHVLPSYSSNVSSIQLVNWCISLGYDSVTEDYKVVIIGECYNQTADEDRRKLYTLNSWRRVKDCPHYLGSTGVFANGALHWISLMRGNNERMIVAFDLATEDYYTLPLPPIIFTRGPFSPKILDALGECLLVTWYGSVYRLDDYGGKNSWTKLFSLSDMGMGNVWPIAYFKSKGEVLYWARSTHVCIWLGIENKIAKKVRTAGARDYLYSQICLPSLVRLSNSDDVGGSKLQKEDQEEEES